MARIAFATFGIMKGPYGSPAASGYEAVEPSVFSAADEHAGLIAMAKAIDDRSDLSNFDRDWGEWGAFRVPRFYTGGTALAEDARASTVSVWRDLQAVFDFSYTGVHRQALANRNRWFWHPEWPSYAVWWVDEDQVPTWTDASERLEHLHDHGSTPFSFNFRAPFQPDGDPAAVPTRR